MVWVSLDCCVFPSPLQIWCCVANLTYKDVARLEVSVQHWWLACVEVQHAPGDAANHGHQLGRVPSGRRTVVQHHIQSPSRAVLHDQVQIVPMLTQTPQAHYVVMRPCRIGTSCLGSVCLHANRIHANKQASCLCLFVCMETALRCLDVNTTSKEVISDNTFIAILHLLLCMIGSLCMRYALQCLDAVLHGICTTVSGCGLA